MPNELEQLIQLRDRALALRERVRVLEAEASHHSQTQRELDGLYAAQSAYLDRQLTSWCATPFAARIAQLEAELGV